MPIPLAVLVALQAPLLALFAGYFLVLPSRPRAMHWPMLLSCAATAAAASAMAWSVAHGGFLDTTLFSWIPVEGRRVEFGVRVDPLSANVLAMIAVVAGLIHCYAVSYMSEDPGYARFFLYFHLFFFSM